MSAPQWKPGDVAMVTARWIRIDDHSERYAVRRPYGWWSRSGVPVRDFEVSAIRPLIVIDPEDREQVERVREAIGGKRGCLAINRTEEMQAALRSLVADPKPEEPQGLGAVVEDAEGERYVRYGTHSIAPWRAEDPDEESRPYRYYKDLDIVRVLSEGVAR